MGQPDRVSRMKELTAILDLQLAFERCKRSAIMTGSHYDLDRELENRQRDLTDELRKELNDHAVHAVGRLAPKQQNNERK